MIYSSLALANSEYYFHTLSSEFFKGVTVQTVTPRSTRRVAVLAMSYLPGPSPDKYCCHSRA